jgi:hypothetical protein
VAGRGRSEVLPAVIQVPGGTVTTVLLKHAKLRLTLRNLANIGYISSRGMRRDIVICDESDQIVYREGPHDDDWKIDRRIKRITSEVQSVGLESWLHTKQIEYGQFGPVQVPMGGLNPWQLAEAEGNYLKYSLLSFFRRRGRKPVDSD